MMGKAFKSNAGILEERLDPGYYKPSLIENDTKIKANGWEPLSSYYSSSGIGNTSSVERYYSKEEGGVPYISGKAIKDFFIDLENCETISKLAHQGDLSKSNLSAGNVLVIRKGDMGNACVVPQDVNQANCSSEVIYLKQKSVCGAYFLTSYLNSEHGQKAFKRLGRGTIIPGVSLLDVPGLPVPKFSEIIQKYIGDKVRQAEQLRAWAKKIEESVKSFHLQMIPSQEHLNFGKRSRRVSIERMTERLDAHFYPGVVEEYLAEHPGCFTPLKELTTTIFNGQTQSETELDYCEQITVAHLSASFISGEPRKVVIPSKNDKFGKQHDILMCNAAHNKSYIGRDLTYLHTDSKLLPSTEVMTIRVDRNKVPASYVRTYLGTKLGYVKIQSTIRGITAHSYPDDVRLLDIYLPKVSSELREAWYYQDELLIEAGWATEMARKLTTTAKLLVEALIEGQLTEEQLLRVQQALEDGDTSLDQGILSKLTEAGFAVESSKPLVSDLDELYRLLEAAKMDTENQ